MEPPTQPLNLVVGSTARPGAEPFSPLRIWFGSPGTCPRSDDEEIAAVGLRVRGRVPCDFSRPTPCASVLAGRCVIPVMSEAADHELRAPVASLPHAKGVAMVATSRRGLLRPGGGWSDFCHPNRTVLNNDSGTQHHHDNSPPHNIYDPRPVRPSRLARHKASSAAGRRVRGGAAHSSGDG